MKSKFKRKFNIKFQALSFKFQDKGFTLVEILVACSVFALLILMVTGIFLGVVNAQRKTVAVRTLQDSVRSVMESMSRDLRTGYDFIPVDNELRFVSTIGGGAQEVSYRWQDSAIQRGVFNSATGQYDFSSLTSPEIRIDYLSFYLRGNEIGDGQQPRIVIVFGGRSGSGAAETTVNIQTTVSQRELQS